jgi:hypothetical protein
MNSRRTFRVAPRAGWPRRGRAAESSETRNKDSPKAVSALVRNDSARVRKPEQRSPAVGHVTGTAGRKKEANQPPQNKPSSLVPVYLLRLL